LDVERHALDGVDGAELGAEPDVEVGEGEDRLAELLGGAHQSLFLFWRGSKASRRPSPMKLTLSAMPMMKMPGHQNSHGRGVKEASKVSMRTPREVSRGCTPKPRKDSEV